MKTPRRAAHFGYLCRREFTAVEVFITTPSGSRCASTAVVDGVGSPQSLLLGNNVHLTCNESGTSTTCCEHDDDGSVVITLEIPQWGVILTNFSVDFDENDGPTTKPNLPNGPATKSLLDDVGCVIGQDVVQPLLLLDILRWPTYCAKKFEHQTSKHTTAVTLDWDQLSLFRYLCKEIFTDWQSPANLTPASHQQPENTIFDLQPRSCTGNTWWVWDELDDDVDYVVPATAGRQTTPWWCSSQQGTTNTRTTPLSWSWTSLLCCVAPPRQHQEHQPAKAKVYTTLDGPVLGYIEETTDRPQGTFGIHEKAVYNVLKLSGDAVDHHPALQPRVNINLLDENTSLLSCHWDSAQYGRHKRRIEQQVEGLGLPFTVPYSSTAGGVLKGKGNSLVNALVGRKAPPDMSAE